MALVILKEDTNEVPWINEWYTITGIEHISVFVREIVATDKGFMVITPEFKAFLYKNSSIYAFLKEALEHWVKNESHNSPLFAVAQLGKLHLAVDDEGVHSNWVKDGKKHIQKKASGTEDSSQVPISNPFLSPPTSVTTNRRKSQSATTPKTMH